MKHFFLVALLISGGAFAASGARDQSGAVGGIRPSSKNPGTLPSRQLPDARTQAYAVAIQSAITRNWLRPDDLLAGVTCPVHIVQIPGGQVISVKISPECPFNEVGKHSIVSAVLRASPLPYQGFEDVFQRDIIFNFTVEK